EIDFPLSIAGDGPLKDMVLGSKNPRIEYVGSISSREVAKRMEEAAFLVVPSLWYEGFPMVLLEAFRAGLPALVAGHGSLSEIVRNEDLGRHFSPGDCKDLVRKAKNLMADEKHRASMSENSVL